MGLREGDDDGVEDEEDGGGGDEEFLVLPHPVPLLRDQHVEGEAEGRPSNLQQKHENLSMNTNAGLSGL